MKFDDLIIGDMLVHFMENKHYIIVIEKTSHKVKFLQFSISERNFRYGYRETNEQVFDSGGSVFENFEFTDRFSAFSKDILISLFERDKVRELPNDFF